MRKILAVLLLFLCMCGVLGRPGSLDGAECALLSAIEHGTLYQVTDGQELVTSTWDSRRQLVLCSVDGEKETVSFFLSRCRREALARDIGGHGRFAEAKVACESLQRVDKYRRRGDSTEPHTRVRRGFTYPGTLWCGAGNNAETETDLGEHRETDSCCRTHDQCEHVIHPFTYSYGYRNLLWHTISHCQCDNKFKECLRSVNDTASRVVGQAFFNVIQVQCFEFTYKEHCVERHWYGWCKKYKNESVAVPRESGLYDYGGDLIDQPAKPENKDHTQPPSVELSPAHPTLGQVLQATEDLLKIMVTISPSTSPDQSKVEENMKKKDKSKKKGIKHTKGKGLKGKRKNQSKKESERHDYSGKLTDLPTKPENRDHTQPPSVELSPVHPTLGQVLQATEDLLKIMVTVSPSTSPDQSKAEDSMKKKDKCKKKGIKHTKGKGLKGKRKNQSKKETFKPPAKEIWGENIAINEGEILDNQPLNSLVDIGHKQDPFNDVLNDDPNRNADTMTLTPIAPTYKYEEFKAMMTSIPPVSRPSTEGPQKKNRRERKGRRQKKKKAKSSSSVTPDLH